MLLFGTINVSKNCGVSDFSLDYNVLLTVRFFGYILFFLKIIIPLIIIILATVDLGKAIIGGDDKAVKDATSAIIRRVVAGIIIFFIPSILGFITSTITGFTSIKSSYDRINTCIQSPFTKCKLNITKCCENGKEVDVNKCK